MGRPLKLTNTTIYAGMFLRHNLEGAQEMMWEDVLKTKFCLYGACVFTNVHMHEHR